MLDRILSNDRFGESRVERYRFYHVLDERPILFESDGSLLFRDHFARNLSRDGKDFSIVRLDGISYANLVRIARKGDHIFRGKRISRLIHDLAADFRERQPVIRVRFVASCVLDRLENNATNAFPSRGIFNERADLTVVQSFLDHAHERRRNALRIQRGQRFFPDVAYVSATEPAQRVGFKRIELQVYFEPLSNAFQFPHERFVLRNAYAVRIEHQVPYGAGFEIPDDIENLRMQGGFPAGDLDNVRSRLDLE